jgi:transcriptional regulator with XRE-family HTH domain
MAATNNPTLGSLLKQRREDLELSYGQLHTATGIGKSQLHALEHDRVQKAPAVQLKTLADALELPLSDLYAAAGLPLPTELPSFSPYMRAKYGQLPAEAQNELAKTFAAIAKKYGYQADGPQPGEDES